MLRILVVFAVIIFFTLPAYSGIVQGGVTKDGLVGAHKVIDSKTNAPISGAKVTLPQENYQTYTDSSGQFFLDSDISSQTVMSVQKQGYKPFSLTVDEKAAAHPIVLGIEKSTPKDIAVETNMFHLGDNSYSDLSANAREFQVKSIGPYYSKTFKFPPEASQSGASLIIGSIIGVDTKMAKKMGQNKVNGAFASPPEVYFNGNKISEIQVNGDSQKIKIPSSLIRPSQPNEITIKTGRNLMQTAYVDYDDIEFMNLTIETK